ncbi:MAG: glycosyltransferase family 9 protein, partial [Desulfovibrionaceae bacterium]
KRLLASLSAAGAETHLCLDASLARLAALLFPDVVLHPIRAHGGAGLRADPAALGRALLGENRRAFAELAALGFDAVYNLNFSGLNFALAGLFDRDSVRGYARRQGQDLKGPWPDLAMRWAADRRIGLNLVDFWGHYVKNPIQPESVNPKAEPRGGGVGVVLAGRESRRSLPPETLAALAGLLRDVLGARRIVLLGSAAEAACGRAVTRALAGRHAGSVEDLAGKTDWAGLVETVAGLDTVLTPDTGVMHLACHLGVPVRAMFLSSAWCWETGPYGAGHRVYQAAMPCAPCLESRPCGLGVRCLAPFTTPEFQRFLARGEARFLPPGLLALETGFDALGVTYAPSAGPDDESAPRRAALRRLLAEQRRVAAAFPAPGTAGAGRTPGFAAENGFPEAPGATEAAETAGSPPSAGEGAAPAPPAPPSGVNAAPDRAHAGPADANAPSGDAAAVPPPLPAADPRMVHELARHLFQERQWLPERQDSRNFTYD